MTNPIGRRLDRLETEIERRTDPGYGAVFKLIDDPRDPENAKRLEELHAHHRHGTDCGFWVWSYPTGPLS
jgi:hypothetical protein